MSIKGRQNLHWKLRNPNSYSWKNTRQDRKDLPTTSLTSPLPPPLTTSPTQSRISRISKIPPTTPKGRDQVSSSAVSGAASMLVQWRVRGHPLLMKGTTKLMHLVSVSPLIGQLWAPNSRVTPLVRCISRTCSSKKGLPGPGCRLS